MRKTTANITLHSENQTFHQRSGTGQRFAFTTFIHIVLELLSRASRQEKEIKSSHIIKKEVNYSHLQRNPLKNYSN